MKLCVLPALFMLLIAWWCEHLGIDLALARKCYDSGSNRWLYGETAPWLQLFKYGTLPAILIGLCSLILVLGGLVSARLTGYSKAALFVLLSFATGCGLLANSVLKENWGRPRPSQVCEFGGFAKFTGPLTPRFGQEGKSFPCGHATTGFVLAAFGLLWWRTRRRLSIAAYTLSIISGLLIGFARITQGAHFASDVIGAAAVCWASVSGCFLLLRMDSNPAWRVRPCSKKARPWMMLVIASVMACSTGLVLLATPYREPIAVTEGGAFWDATLVNEFGIESFGENRVSFGHQIGIHGEVQGFGMPRSRVKWALKSKDGVARFFLIVRGWFTELQMQLSHTVPDINNLRVNLSCPNRHGSWDLDLTNPPSDVCQQWHVLEGRAGHVVVRLKSGNGVSVRWRDDENRLHDLVSSPGHAGIVVWIEGPSAPELIIMP